MSALTVKCPHCDSTEIHGADRVPVTAHIGSWTRNDSGELTPEFAGGSEVDWDGQRPENPARPYVCTDCAQHLAAGELITTEE